jgi:23S rRNA (guanosine2251-2'-O)-methyltransferase
MKGKKEERAARQNKHANSMVAPAVYDEFDLRNLLSEKKNPLVLILDCIQDPHNLGACLRSAAAADVDCVIMPKDKTAPLTDTVLRVSCGGAQTIPLVRVTNLVRSMEMLKEMGVWIIGTTDSAKQHLYEMDFKGAVAIVMGAEGDGMRRLTMEHCDFLTVIPMSDKIPCLNVSVATGVCLFEAKRQRLVSK